MKTIVNIALGVILAVVLLVAGCAALIGGAANEVQEDSDRTAITEQQYRQVKTGDRKADVEAELGDPQSADEFSTEIDGLDKPVGSSCIHYGKKDELVSGYQFCFDVNTDKLESKSSF
ncbi:hypothetical protein [Patulibacter americanus]|uniref:hypothetical protein n=1 Tax=Patulibacter americanus TaxID=588672 RepID=UPI0003B4322E|nr:hypothetical protein [Patulibacter americanus]